MRLSVVVLPLLLVGCGAFGGDGGDDNGSSGTTPPPTDDAGGPPPVGGPPADFALQFVPLAKDLIFVIQGAAAKVPVTLIRGKAVADPVTLTVEGLPAGVTAAPVQFGLAETKAELTIQAAGDAAQAPVHATLRVTSGDLNATTPIELFVRGAPGSLDTTFETAGFVPGIGAADQCNSAIDLAMLADDRFVVLGSEQSNPCLARFSADGKIDVAYGVAGIASVPNHRQPGKAVALANGKVVVLAKEDGSFGLANKVSLRRLNADGTLDTTFGPGGVCDSPLSPATATVSAATGLAVRPSDGALFAQVHLVNGAQRSIGLQKVGGNCEPAAAFGANGLSPVSWSTDTVPHGLLLRGEKPVSIGLSSVDPATYGIAQVDGTTGALDAAFGTGGRQFWAGVPKPASDFGEPSGMALLPSGVIVANFRLATGFVVASIEADGKSLTPGFGSGGALTLTTAGRPTDLARQPDGKLLLNVLESGATASVRRLNANGTADATFGNAGAFADPRFRSKRVALQKDGRIIVLGQATTTTTSNMTLVRLWN